MTATRITRTAGAAIITAAFAITLAAPQASQAEVVPGLVVSAQNAFTPVAAMSEGATAFYANAGPAMHSIVSTARKPGTTQPLFASATVGAGQVTEIAGAERLAAGDYTFFCGLHGGMTGTLVVVPLDGGH